jgi:Flp pilus assembly pilin Flp
VGCCLTFGHAMQDRRGVSATEYVILLLGIAGLVLAAGQVLGSDISTALGAIGGYLVTSTAAL